MDAKRENIMRIESRLEKLWEDGVREGKRIEKKQSPPIKWILLPISGNEMLVCDSCYKDIKAQDMHINVTNGSKKVLCEKCWEKEEDK